MLRRGMMAQAASGGGATLFDIISALPGLQWYGRLGEASGATAVNEAGADGAYTGGTLGQPALYTGGPTSYADGYVDIPSSLSVSSTGLGIVCIVHRTSAASVQIIAVRDDEGVNRRFALRFDGERVRFYQNSSGFNEVFPVSNIAPSDETAMWGVSVFPGGSDAVAKVYKNGAVVGSATFPLVDYGASIGTRLFRYQATGSFQLSGRGSESALLSTPPSDADHAAMAAAAGF